MFRDKWADEDLPQYSELLEKFVFHMMDGADDVLALADCLRSADTADFENRLHRFFLHALPHLVSAGQLYDYVPEIFTEQRGVNSCPTQDDEPGVNMPMAQSPLVG
jgi:hypothetical protein